MDSIIDKYVMIPPSEGSRLYNIVLKESDEAKEPRAICFQDLIELGSCMECFNFINLSSTEKQNIWSSSDWIMQPKYAGTRLFIYVSPDGCAAFSNSFENDVPVDFTSKLCLDNIDVSGLEHTYLLDCIVTSIKDDIAIDKQIRSAKKDAATYILSLNSKDSLKVQRENDYPLKFIVLDLVKEDANWVTGISYKERQNRLSNIFTDLLETQLPLALPDSYVDEKLVNYKNLKNKYSGVIFKNIISEYITKPSISRNGCVVLNNVNIQKGNIRLKAFVTGFGTGYNEDTDDYEVNSLDFSTYIQNQDGSTELKKIAKIMDLPKSNLLEMTSLDARGNLHLNTDYYNRIALLEGTEITPLFQRLKNAVLVEWLDEYNPEKCVIRRENLEEGVR